MHVRCADCGGVSDGLRIIFVRGRGGVVCSVDLIILYESWNEVGDIEQEGERRTTNTLHSIPNPLTCNQPILP